MPRCVPPSHRGPAERDAPTFPRGWSSWFGTPHFRQAVGEASRHGVAREDGYASIRSWSFLPRTSLETYSRIEPEEKEVADEGPEDPEEAEDHEHGASQVHILAHEGAEHERAHRRQAEDHGDDGAPGDELRKERTDAGDKRIKGKPDRKFEEQFEGADALCHGAGQVLFS